VRLHASLEGKKSVKPRSQQESKLVENWAVAMIEVWIVKKKVADTKRCRIGWKVITQWFTSL
jgi:hypothetical protein